MSYTNKTPNFDLPQWIGTDKPTFLGDFNSAFSAIDTAMKNNEDAAAAAVGTANAASATATSANTNANTALNTANTAKTSADAATTAAASATTTANAAQTTANAAARTAQANNIENLAPAYDPTLTYNVGDLVTYVDAQNSGKLYKCIIAVNTPMEFNVNYWDDVTCSEVFSNDVKVIASVTGDGVKTYEDALLYLYSVIGNMKEKIKMSLIEENTLKSRNVFTLTDVNDEAGHTTPADENWVRFTRAVAAGNEATISSMLVSESRATYNRLTIDYTSLTPVHNDYTSTVLVSGSKLYIVLNN